MRIKQLFKSTSADHVIGEFEFSDASTAVSIPIPGDHVNWIAGGTPYSGRVKDRFIAYSAPEMSLGRDDAFDVTVSLTIELERL